MMDGEILDRRSVPVLQAAIRQLVRRDSPASPDGLQGVRGCPTALVQAVESKRSVGCRVDRSDFLNLEILGSLLELHRSSAESRDFMFVVRASARCSTG